MNKSPQIESFLNNLVPTLAAADEILNAWNGEGCYKFPVLLGQLSVQLNWTKKQIRSYDPIVREYVRTHSEWYVTPGAKGGIMKASEKQKKLDMELAKKKAKEEIKAALEEAVAAKAVDKVSNDNAVVSE